MAGLDWLEQATRGRFTSEPAATPAAAQSTLYGRLQATANRLLKGKGQTVTLTNISPGVYDPTTGSVANATSTQTGTGALLDYGFHQAGIYSAPGSLVRVGDKQLLLSPLNSAGAALTAPEPGDTVVVAGITYTITQVKAMAPAGTVVIFDCNLRA